MPSFLTAYAGQIVERNMTDALALEDVGVAPMTDEITLVGGTIAVMGINPLSGFGKLGFAGATLCAAPTDAVEGGGSGNARYVY